MRRCSSLYDIIASRENLWGAWRDFRRGKRARRSVRAFELDADRHVLRLHRDLTKQLYRPGPYHLKLIREPKKRLVAAAQVRDRVAHHALHRILSLQLDPGLIETTYACLPGRGSHRAVLAFVGALRRYSQVMMLDIRHYFLSVNRSILLDLMARRLKEARLLDLLHTILESGSGIYRHPSIVEFLELDEGFPPQGCGLPIGNLTSQWWGNHYLSGLDHFAKRQLKVPHYQRYMDDITLFCDSRAALLEARDEMAEWLLRERRLHLKQPNAIPRPTNGRFTYLGYRVSRSGAQPTREMTRRMQRRVSELVLRGENDAIERSIASYGGLLCRHIC